MKVVAMGKVPVKSWADEIESSAMQQLHALSQMPFIHKHVAVMPDVHAGIGSTVGSVIPTDGAVIPAAVGVDIGCGMMARRLAGARVEHLPESLTWMREEIEAVVPVGFGKHQHPDHSTVADLYRMFQYVMQGHEKAFARRKDKPADIIAQQFGTLGGGNHFIELCVDESGDLWVMLHSGSRGIGNAIGQYFIELAREDMRRHFINLPDRDLAYFPEGTEHFKDYMRAVTWAQDYARENREQMMRRILLAIRKYLPRFNADEKAVNCHHNYVECENHYGKNVLVTRKGAVRARVGDMGIIPGSMGARSYIVRGKGNDESFHSCSHGAGRKMSRSEAKRIFTVDDMVTQTEGVECRKDEGVVDEIPGAYKDIDMVMAQQSDLVEIVHTLKQVLCVKG